MAKDLEDSSVDKKRSFFTDLINYFGRNVDNIVPRPTQRLRLSGRGIRIPTKEAPFLVEMGKQRLYIYPDTPEDAKTAGPPWDFILFDPERYFSSINHFLRLTPGQKFAVNHNLEEQTHVFSHPRDTFRRHLQISHEGKALVFKDPISELGTYVSLIREEQAVSRVTDRRHEALDRLVEIFGGPIEPLGSAEALDCIRRVNRLLKKDPYRRQDPEGNVGGLVELPPELTPIIVGDLHAQVDNLLKILSENAFLESMVRGEAVLITIGDTVHSEVKGQLENMDSSLVMMDLVMKLKLRFPYQVFFVVGNHDSFSPDVMKGGVPQGLLWENHVVKVRGEEYRDELALFYRQSPVVVMSDDFFSCHAGPPRSKVSRDMLVDIWRFPGLVRELTWNRVKRRSYPVGYTKGDVRRFRKSLELAKDTPFIVGHYPLSTDRTFWLNVGEIENHHVIYSAWTDEIGVFTRIDGEILPQIYRAEPLVAWLNERARADLPELLAEKINLGVVATGVGDNALKLNKD